MQTREGVLVKCFQVNSIVCANQDSQSFELESSPSYCESVGNLLTDVQRESIMKAFSRLVLESKCDYYFFL
jgi:hypothetical protein